MSSYKFSFYKGPIRNIKPEKEITLYNAIELIKSDIYKDDILKLRGTDNESTRKTLKNCLPYITFSGTFTKRLTESLKLHSGLICIDLDPYKKVNNKVVLSNPRLLEEFDIVKEELVLINWVTAVFISPSGTGYKVVIKIPSKYHDKAFDSLKKFFADNLSLEVDKGVRDIARACFVSWDPTVYYNPASDIYNDFEEDVEQQNIRSYVDVPANPDEISDFEIQHKNSKILARVSYVVEQLEREELDLTSEYDNWQLIAFSLASVGEEGRSYFHRVSKLYNGYDKKVADEKFDDALNKGRFKNANKFFSLARQEGLSTELPTTIQEAQKKAEVKQVIGDDDSTNEFLQFGIYLDKATGCYWSLDNKEKKRRVSNFNLRILYHINTGADEAYKFMQIKSIHGLEKTFRINTDDFVSAGSFKRVIMRYGNFIWMGMDHDLVRLQDMLQRHEKHTEMVATLGWNKRNKFYAFANGIYDTVKQQFLPIDSYGIVEKDNNGDKINFFIPALSKAFADKDDLFSNEKKFRFINGKTTYSEWSNQFVKVFGDNGRIGLVFWACALFSDILFKSMGQRMPMPFSYGKRGSGKGTMTQSLTRMWGEKQDQIMLGGATTVVGFMRKMAQFSNGLVWLDEYKNNLQIKVIESIKNLFDRIGYERGKKDNGFSTESTPILSAVWLSGQEMPTAEPALFTRTILLTFVESTFTEQERQEFRKLQRMEDDGISHLTVDFLAHRGLFEEKFQEVYEDSLREFSTYINNNDVDERLVGNYSMLLATARIMNGLNMLPFDLNDFRSQCRNMVMNQYFILKGSDDTSKFWQVVEQLVSSYVLKSEEHFSLANGFIYIYVQDVYHHYVKAMNDRREVNILDKSTLENYLKSDSKSYVSRKKKTIGQKYSWAMQFKYKELDIDLIRGTSPHEIKQKYVEMGLTYETDKDEVPDDGMPKAVQIEADFTIKK